MSRLITCLLCSLVLVLPVQAQEDLATSSAINGSIEAGETDIYTFASREGYFVRGYAFQKTVDVVVRVVGPDGQEVLEADSPARGPESFQFESEQEGTYRLEISGFEGQTGAYHVVITHNEPLASDPEGKVEQRMAAHDADDVPGAAVHIWQNGKTVYKKAWGMGDLTHELPFNTDSPTNIGSTSKQFTAMAIMLLVEDGSVDLDSEVQEYIPEIPAFERPVTVRHLLTHTSGYREFLNLITMTGRRLDLGDTIQRSELIDIMSRQPALQADPGEVFNYNNTAFGLAAVIVERVSNMPFHEFMEERVFAPLGMEYTWVRPTPEHIIPGRTVGYAAGPDGYLEKVDLGGAVGAGGIYSTLDDLKIWGEHYMAPTLVSKESIEQMWTSFSLNDGQESGYGFGLFIDEQNGVQRVHHGGADVAHRSQFVVYPELNAGITVQSNDASFNSNQAFEIVSWFFEELREAEVIATDEAVAFDPASYDPSMFDEFVGRYALDTAPAFILTFSRGDSTLYTQATGQPQLEIEPTSATSFKLLAVEAALTFERNEDGEVDGVILDQGGVLQHASRLEEAEAEEVEEKWIPKLEDFAGTYFSQEIETIYRFELSDSTLTRHHRRMDPAPLSPTTEDRFMGGGMTFEFERDRNGKVIGFYLSNVRTTNVRFDLMEGVLD